ncbi:MMPL family transporter [Mycobacterium vicinigordonae]|uniref:MMPL family transporter n=1 Tax=Mycobacterium vicinigordonae TaxID=1719132 RepID=A0A7D6I429_9MYCO|nr:MMPL family transporter [Mycobacterium vicinigordonae]QLL05376.1 MMPL family transporter [Mycobacterium vicinigordonae]
MLRRLAALTVRRPKTVLLAVMVMLGVSVALGGSVSDKLGTGGNTDPSSESSKADEYLDQHFGTTANLVIQLLPREGTVEAPEVATVKDRVLRVIAAEPKAKVTRAFGEEGTSDLRSKDGRSGLILVHVGGTSDESAETAKRIIGNLPQDANVTVRAGGALGVQQEIRDKVKHDLKTSESIAVPISLAVLVIVFGGLIAAVLPVVVGVVSIVSTLSVLLLMTSITDVSVHALTVTTAFGLGLSIDFGLLMVSRFREELANGKDHHPAVIATVNTAGRTILFSAATVTLAMTSLLVFPTYFLRSVGLAATATVLLSAFSAIVVLPALLALLGKRVDSFSVIRRKVAPSADSMFWRRFAELVTHRPLLYALPVVALLLGLGVPFLNVQFATPDERALPDNSSARLVAESLQGDFPLDPSQAVTLVTRNDAGVLQSLAPDISRMDGVVMVTGPIGRFEHGQAAGQTPAVSGSSYAIVYLSVQADSDTAQHLVRDIRARITNHQVEVGGPTATLIDSQSAIGDKLPLAIGLIAGATFVLLFLFTGSVVVPVKALLLNLLVLSGVLGIMVWVFQEGHLAGLLGITPAPLNLSMVVLLCAIAFSLSVDYEIFLLSRIKEARDSGLSNTASTVIGLGRVGRIVTSAALLLTITLISFANGLSFMKMFGIGTALAVVIDASIIRGVVVPAFLQLAGDLNWWAPRPLRWLHDRIGISEGPSDVETVLPAEAAAPQEMPVQPAVPVVEEALSEPGMPVPLLAEVEVIPGQHLVSNVNGTVIVVAHRERAPLSQHSIGSQQMAALVDMVARTDPQKLVAAFAKLAREPWDHTMVDIGIIMPTVAGLEILLCGSVTVALDSGYEQTVLRGRGRLVHRSVPVPAVATVITVDEFGVRPHHAPETGGVYKLTGGTVPGQGAVVWSTQVASAPRPAVVAPNIPSNEPKADGSNRIPAAAVPGVAQQQRWLSLDDGSRIDIDRDCVIGRDPNGSDAAQSGLRPVRIDDHSGEMSRAHAEVRIVGGEVVIIDRNSTNGVFVRESAQMRWTRLTPWAPNPWQPGAYVQIGGRILRLHVSADHAAPHGPRVQVHHGVMRRPQVGQGYGLIIAN